MDTRISAHDGKAVISLSGRFDYAVLREFSDAVTRALESMDLREIQVDLGGVAYLDSAALGMLLVLRDKALGVNRVVTLANCKGSVKQVLDIANFSELFQIT